MIIPNPKFHIPTAIIAGLFMLGLSQAASAAPGDGGSSAAEFLRLGAGARAPAVGDAMTASAEGTLAAFYNPAGLGWAGASSALTREVAVTYQSLAGEAHYGDLAYSLPLGDRNGLSLAVKYVDYGSIDRTTLTTAGAVVTGNRGGTFGAQDLSASLGFGRRWSNVSIGASGKLVSVRLDDVTALAGAVDVGAQFRPDNWPVRFGATVQNIGSNLQFDRTDDDLPLLGRLGLTAAFFKGRARFHADAEKARNERISFMGGGEFDVASMLTLRGGYDGRNDAAKSPFALGLGAHAGSLTLDYAYAPFGAFGDNHRAGLTYGF